MKNLMAKLKRITCPHCGKTFFGYKKRAHVRIYNKEYRYVCPVCAAKAAALQGLPNPADPGDPAGSR